MGKISLSNIADELAAKGGITHEAANGFVHSFIATIEKGLKEDGMVKVKGLGTFKLLEVSDRSSVNVNTGERIVIKGYRKISFTPDSVMKELVNRPFAHFEPTELNEGFPAEEELEALVDSADENGEVELADEMVDTPVEVEAVVEEPIAEESVVEEPVVEESAVEETVAEEPIVEESVVEESAVEESVAEEPIVEEPAADEPVAEELVVPIKQKKRSGNGCLVMLLLALVVVGAAYFVLDNMEEKSIEKDKVHGEIVVKSNLEEELRAEWGSEPEESPAEKSEVDATSVAPQAETVEQKVETTPVVVEKSKSSSAEKVVPAAEVKFCAVAITASLQSKSVKDITPADTTDYAMEGTLLTHKLKSGETIIQLSNKYYGDKRLWPYIVKYNNMKNFNNVAIGQKVDIPILKEKTTK